MAFKDRKLEFFKAKTCLGRQLLAKKKKNPKNSQLIFSIWLNQIFAKFNLPISFLMLLYFTYEPKVKPKFNANLLSLGRIPVTTTAANFWWHYITNCKQASPKLQMGSFPSHESQQPLYFCTHSNSRHQPQILHSKYFWERNLHCILFEQLLGSGKTTWNAQRLRLEPTLWRCLHKAKAYLCGSLRYFLLSASAHLSTKKNICPPV